MMLLPNLVGVEGSGKSHRSLWDWHMCVYEIFVWVALMQSLRLTFHKDPGIFKGILC